MKNSQVVLLVFLFICLNSCKSEDKKWSSETNMTETHGEDLEDIVERLNKPVDDEVKSSRVDRVVIDDSNLEKDMNTDAGQKLLKKIQKQYQESQLPL